MIGMMPTDSASNRIEGSVMVATKTPDKTSNDNEKMPNTTLARISAREKLVLASSNKVTKESRKPIHTIIVSFESVLSSAVARLRDDSERFHLSVEFSPTRTHRVAASVGIRALIL